MKRDVTLIEVGPRDGLQNELLFVPTKEKIRFINELSDSGIPYIEATSFVSPKAIPQLSDNYEVYTHIKKLPGIIYSALIPNEHGMHQALRAGVNHIACFTAASETFNQRNIHCSIEESIHRMKPVINLAKLHNIPVRAYISCILGCPYEGAIAPEKVAKVAYELMKLGVEELSLGDTIGVGTPKQTLMLLKAMESVLPKENIALHFHNTYGQALANIYASLDAGIHRFDASTAGLGGCPYARGSSGNIAMEDVLYIMHGLGLETGIDIYKVVEAGDKLCQHLNKKNQSQVANALLASAGANYD